MKTNVALVGFMGTGKTAVGQAVARILGMKFVETDALIEMKANKSVPQIFAERDEIAFRELEIDVIREVSAETGAVIACGGGVVLNWINIERLHQNAVIVHLSATPAVTYRRVADQVSKRPLLNVPDPRARIGELIRFRRPFYERAADIKIDTSRLTIEEAAHAVIAELKKDASFRQPK